MLTSNQDAPQPGESPEMPGSKVARSPRSTLSAFRHNPRALWPEHARKLYDYLVAIYGEDDLLPTLSAAWIAHQRSVNTQKSYARGFRAFEEFARDHGTHPMAVKFVLADTFRMYLETARTWERVKGGRRGEMGRTGNRVERVLHPFVADLVQVDERRRRPPKRFLPRGIRVRLTQAPHSFPAGTEVLMAYGTHRPIEQIQVGDLVTATDPDTGATKAQPVTRTISTPDDRYFTDITLTDGSGLTSTDHHPYWVENRKRWVDAVDLRIGDALRTPVGTAIQITETSHWKGLKPAYDLTVEDTHTYYVNTGTSDILVHNTGGTSCDKWVLDAWADLPKTTKTVGYAFAEGKRFWKDAHLERQERPLR
ncbi:Hint domain-containing protein [Streptomyces sp. NPDC001674]|uniref:Hint domain-containing protein n=1 Tax=Streptomyces sp. NPDC001674 TaxID=3154394 RepID=UPI00332E6A6F